MKCEHEEVFETDDFQMKLVHLIDIFEHYNSFNRQLLGNNTNIVSCKQATHALTRKLELWSGKIKLGEAYMFQELCQKCDGKIGQKI